MPDPERPPEHHQHDDTAPRQAVDTPTATHLLDGVVHDSHGEVQLDPESTDADVAEHRRAADVIESHSEQAADETRGATAGERP